MVASRADVCAPDDVSGVAAAAVSDVDYVAFSSDDGSVRKMAVIRRAGPRVAFGGRYRIGAAIGSGGMATVHLGRLDGPVGFSRTVAIKRLHARLAAESCELVDRFVDEARIASHVRHRNVVPTLDVVVQNGELLLVLDYVAGESLGRARTMARHAGERIPPSVASAIVVGALRGLHAAHEATSAQGTPLEIVHRDVSPENVLVGVDGVARVLDFGIAKAAGRIHQTSTRDIKGKLAYMAPEQLAGESVDRRCDLFSAGVILWEALSGDRLFRGEDALATMDAVFRREVPALVGWVEGVDAELDEVLARALAKEAVLRFATAQEMARALEAALPPAHDREVAEWLERIAGPELEARARVVAAFEREEMGEAASFRPVTSADVDAEESETSTSTIRRDALAPPPFGMATEDASIGELPQRPALETVPAIDQGGALALPPLSRAPPAPVGVTETRTLLTPFVMVAPTFEQLSPPCAEGDGELSAGEPTRAGPPPRARAAVKVPIPIPYAHARASRRAPIARIALLVVLPPAIAAMAILAVHARGRGRDPMALAAAGTAPQEAASGLPPGVAVDFGAAALAAPMSTVKAPPAILSATAGARPPDRRPVGVRHVAPRSTHR